MDRLTGAVLKRVQTQLSEVLESAVIVGVPLSDRKPVLAIYGYADDLLKLSKAVYAKMEASYEGPAFGPASDTCAFEVISRAHAQLLEVLESAVIMGVPLADNTPVLTFYGKAEDLRLMTRELTKRLETADGNTNFSTSSR